MWDEPGEVRKAGVGRVGDIVIFFTIFCRTSICAYRPRSKGLMSRLYGY